MSNDVRSIVKLRKYFMHCGIFLFIGGINCSIVWSCDLFLVYLVIFFLLIFFFNANMILIKTIDYKWIISCSVEWVYVYLFDFFLKKREMTFSYLWKPSSIDSCRTWTCWNQDCWTRCMPIRSLMRQITDLFVVLTCQPERIVQGK